MMNAEKSAAVRFELESVKVAAIICVLGEVVGLNDVGVIVVALGSTTT